jgi:hypothetical protein
VRFIKMVTFAAALGCAPGWAQTLPKYVPPSAYRALTCDQLAQEGRAISKRGFAASGLRAGQGGSDATPSASAIVFLWPEIPHGRDKQQSESIATADGQMDAVEQASVESQCSIRFQQPPAP